MAWVIIIRSHGNRQPLLLSCTQLLLSESVSGLACGLAASICSPSGRALLASDVMSAHWQPSTFLLQWMKSISKTQLLEKDDPAYAWRERIFQAV